MDDIIRFTETRLNAYLAPSVRNALIDEFADEIRYIEDGWKDFIESEVDDLEGTELPDTIYDTEYA